MARLHPAPCHNAPNPVTTMTPILNPSSRLCSDIATTAGPEDRYRSLRTRLHSTKTCRSAARYTGRPGCSSAAATSSGWSLRALQELEPCSHTPAVRCHTLATAGRSTLAIAHAAAVANVAMTDSLASPVDATVLSIADGLPIR